MIKEEDAGRIIDGAMEELVERVLDSATGDENVAPVFAGAIVSGLRWLDAALDNHAFDPDETDYVLEVVRQHIEYRLTYGLWNSSEG